MKMFIALLIGWFCLMWNVAGSPTSHSSGNRRAETTNQADTTYFPTSSYTGYANPAMDRFTTGYPINGLNSGYPLNGLNTGYPMNGLNTGYPYPTMNRLTYGLGSMNPVLTGINPALTGTNAVLPGANPVFAIGTPVLTAPVLTPTGIYRVQG